MTRGDAPTGLDDARRVAVTLAARHGDAPRDFLYRAPNSLSIPSPVLSLEILFLNMMYFDNLVLVAKKRMLNHLSPPPRLGLGPFP